MGTSFCTLCARVSVPKFVEVPKRNQLPLGEESCMSSNNVSPNQDFTSSLGKEGE